METMEISPLEAVQLKSLVEKETRAKQEVYDAIKRGKLHEFYAKKRAHENCCADLWQFNMHHGVWPTVKVIIPETEPC